LLDKNSRTYCRYYYYRRTSIDIYLQLSLSHLISISKTHCRYITIAESYPLYICDQNRILFKIRIIWYTILFSALINKNFENILSIQLLSSKVIRYIFAIFVVVSTVFLSDIFRLFLSEIFWTKLNLQFLNIRTAAYKLLTENFYAFFSFYITDLDERVRI